MNFSDNKQLKRLINKTTSYDIFKQQNIPLKLNTGILITNLYAGIYRNKI